MLRCGGHMANRHSLSNINALTSTLTDLGEVKIFTQAQDVYALPSKFFVHFQPKNCIYRCSLLGSLDEPRLCEQMDNENISISLPIIPDLDTTPSRRDFYPHLCLSQSKVLHSNSFNSY